MKSLLVALVLLVLAAFAVEGALSLGGARTLRDRITGVPAEPAPAWAELPGRAPAPSEPGLYRVHPDPLVNYVLRPDSDLAIHDGQIRSDALGLRARPGPSRPGALRLAVLGDSVAFGFGLDDEQTLAHRLELLLNDAAGSGGRAVECRTVAMPGWNGRNAVAFLRDHWDALQPDVVVCLPIANDLVDTETMDETGHRLWRPDPASADPWLALTQGTGFHGEQTLLQKLRGRGAMDLAGAPALAADISPESSRRYDENADTLAELAAMLRAHGGRLMIAHCQGGMYVFHLQRRLEERGLRAPEVPMVPLFSRLPAEFTLGFDPHPNAEAVDAMARWIAGALMTAGWVAGDPARLPPVSEALRALHAAGAKPDTIRDGSDSLHRDQRAALRATIDMQTGEGGAQVYGGLHDDLTIGAHALFLLRRAGDTLRVKLAPIPRRPDAYPLGVSVAVDGVEVGQVRLTGDGPAEAVLRLPPPGPAGEAGDGAVPMEVRLVPERAVVAGRPGRRQLVACSVLGLWSE